MEGCLTLASLRKVRKFRGGKLVLDGLDFEVVEGAKVGVFGQRGASALLEILAGVGEADSGEVEIRRGAKRAYLPPLVDGDERTPLEIARESRLDLQNLEDGMRRCAKRAGSPESSEEMALAFVEQENLLRRFRELGGPAFEREARSLLAELAGLDRAEMGRPTLELSVGRRKLVALVACLMRKPDILILDEPDACLEPERRGVLEDLARRFDGAVVVASRERYLLDRVSDEIFEVRDAGIRFLGFGARGERASNVVDIGAKKK